MKKNTALLDLVFWWKVKVSSFSPCTFPLAGSGSTSAWRRPEPRSEEGNQGKCEHACKAHTLFIRGKGGACDFLWPCAFSQTHTHLWTVLTIKPESSNLDSTLTQVTNLLTFYSTWQNKRRTRRSAFEFDIDGSWLHYHPCPHPSYPPISHIPPNSPYMPSPPCPPFLLVSPPSPLCHVGFKTGSSGLLISSVLVPPLINHLVTDIPSCKPFQNVCVSAELPARCWDTLRTPEPRWCSPGPTPSPSHNTAERPRQERSEVTTQPLLLFIINIIIKLSILFCNILSCFVEITL